MKNRVERGRTGKRTVKEKVLQEKENREGKEGREIDDKKKESTEISQASPDLFRLLIINHWNTCSGYKAERYNPYTARC